MVCKWCRRIEDTPTLVEVHQLIPTCHHFLYVAKRPVLFTDSFNEICMNAPRVYGGGFHF
eukprot:12428778-Prorocentrum_lima.AAC.1